MSISKELIIFTHIPKTAGSTVGAMAQRNYSKTFTFYSRKNNKGTSLQDWIHDFNSDPNSRNTEVTKLLRGHIGCGIDRFLDYSSCTYMTVLRDPIDRVISHYYYFRHKGVAKAAVKMNFEEYLHSRKFIIVDNFQTRFLSGLGWRLSPDYIALYGNEFNIKYGKCTDEMLNIAKHNLKNYYVFGLKEKLPESVNLFKQVLGWQEAELKPRPNLGKNRPKKEEVEPDLIEFIKEQNTLDIQLYEYAQNLFDHQLEDIRSDSRLITKAA